MVDAGWVALSLQRHIGVKTLHALLQHFPETEDILAAEELELRGVKGIGPQTARAIRAIDLDTVRAAMARWQRSGVHIVRYGLLDYPEPLMALNDPPATLFIRGGWHKALWADTVAIVGTRRPSRLALAAAFNLAHALAKSGRTVVSGLAVGIDRAAHEGALRADQGSTIAVLGSGVLNIYPKQHVELARKITERGAVISEWNPEVGVSASRLVPRNRVITGLATATVIAETTVTGGAMYAARFAQQQGRPLFVFQLPAPGNRALIESGAVPIAPNLRNLPPELS